MTNGTRSGWEVSVTPRPVSTPGERHGTYCTGGWVSPRAGLEMCWNSRPLPGFDSRTVQPVASHCNNWASWPTETALRDCFFIQKLRFSVKKNLISVTSLTLIFSNLCPWRLNTIGHINWIYGSQKINGLPIHRIIT
jgi:hypothetical protein